MFQFLVTAVQAMVDLGALALADWAASVLAG